MKNFIKIYTDNKTQIESFLINTLRDYKLNYEDKAQCNEAFKRLPSLELLYVTDKTYKQISPNIYRKEVDPQAAGKTRKYLLEKLHKSADDFYISDPYLSTTTGNICITLSKKDNDRYIFMDFTLDKLLGRLGLIELHPEFNRFTRDIYKLIGFSLVFFTLLSMVYAFYSFVTHIPKEGFTINTLFKPIVTITLALAIFDLAKTILEREVFFKSYGDGEHSMILTKFSIAIIVALSIEALMVVFKITLHDYTQMIHALYLILGVGIVIVSLGIYTFLSGKR